MKRLKFILHFSVEPKFLLSSQMDKMMGSIAQIWLHDLVYWRRRRMAIPRITWKSWGRGFPIRLWLTCQIGGWAWWWVCKNIIDLLKVFIVWLELCCKILCSWGWWAWCCYYICGGFTNLIIKDVVGSCILACIH
jgi:hypothetical protein